MVWAVRSVLLYPSAKCAALRSLRTSNIVCKSSLEYPDAPRVGIGVVTLRRVQQQTEVYHLVTAEIYVAQSKNQAKLVLCCNQVLLIRRGKEPGKGCLSFPGGSLELGETMQDCAVREILEETGLQLRNNVPPGMVQYSGLGTFVVCLCATLTQLFGLCRQAASGSQPGLSTTCGCR